MTGKGPIFPDSRTSKDAINDFNKALDDKLKPKVRNVFISFHVEDEAQVNLLRYQKDNDFGLQFRDYSIKEPFDNAWKTNCKDKLGQCTATIVMIGPDTANREAVIWEIEQTIKLGHKVIGVKIYKDKEYPIPKPLLNNKCPIVEWDLAKISKLLEP